MQVKRDFKELKTGFRAPYIMDAIRRNREGQFDKMNLRAWIMNRALKNL